MSKKFLSLFAFVLVLVPTFLLVGCGSPEPIQYNVALELIDAPDEKYFEVTSQPTGKFDENSTVTLSVKFKEGYRPDNLVAKINDVEITQPTIMDTTANTFYTRATALSHEVEWSYKLINLDADTTFCLDFSACEVGKVSLSLDDTLSSSLKYAILGDEPTTQVTNASELSTVLGEQVLTAQNGEISVPYNSYVVFLPENETVSLTFSNTDETSDLHNSSTTVKASYDYVNLDFYEYEIDETAHHVVPITIGDSWNKITANASVANLKNAVANTFAVQSITDGTLVSGLASENATDCGQLALAYTNSDAQEGVPISKSFTYGDKTLKYYMLGDAKRVYSNIADEQISSDAQCSLANTYSAWVEEDLVMVIDGLCHFNNDTTTDETTRDHYYLSTSPNIEDANCTKVDVSKYFIEQKQDGSVSQYFIYIPKTDVQEILNNNSAFVTELNGNKYAFAYLVLEKNEKIENIVKMTVTGYDYEDFDLSPTLLGFGVDTTGAIDEDTVKSGQVTYVDYANTVSDKIAPIYYLYKSDAVQNSTYYGINIRLPVLKIDGITTTMYESCDYTIMYNGGSYDTQTGTITFAESDYAKPFVGTTKRLVLNTIDCDFTLSIKLNAKDFEESSHEISGVSGQEKSIYYQLTNLADFQGVPTDASKWSALAGTPLNTAFDQTKVLLVLANLSTTTTETAITTEKLCFMYVCEDDATDMTGDASSTDTSNTDGTTDTDNTEGSTDANSTTETSTHYDTLYEASVYKDMFGNTVNITIDGTAYQVLYFVLPQGYHDDGEEFFIDIITATSDIESPSE